MGIPETEPAWPLPLRIVFRFVFAYLVFYLPSVVFNAIPAFETESDPYTKLCDPMVLWAGKHVFGVEITIRPAGSGDTTWNYVQVFCFAVLAAVITVIWSALDSRRPNYRRLNAWLRVAIRFCLAMTMFIYGAVKVIKSQFPDPSLDRLMRSYGDSSPMGLLWTFMGFSEGYNFFAGSGELLGGILLMTRRTTLLGALVSLGVMGHVAVLNMCYDVPVKLLSLHLVALAILLILPDAQRLADFFLFNRSAPPADHPRLFRWRWANVAGGVLGMLLLGAFLVWSLKEARDSRNRFASAERSPLYGIWSVEEFALDGQSRPPLTTDGLRWRRVVFDNPRFIVVHLMNDSRAFYRFQLNEEGRSFELSIGRPENLQSFAFTYERPETDVLQIAGSLAGQKISARLRRSQSEFFLTNRGFHWINEFPLNR
jgi:uncharacterized membrane protein YphA (DoxX/SURF4 family)